MELNEAFSQALDCRDRLGIAAEKLKSMTARSRSAILTACAAYLSFFSKAPIPCAMRLVAITSEMIAAELNTTTHHLPPVRKP